MNLPARPLCHEVPQAAMVMPVAALNSAGVICMSGRKTSPVVEGDAAEGGVADGAGLLVDFLEHEVLVAGLFGLDGIPLDALDFEGEGVVVEVGEADAGGGEDGDFAVGEEVDVAGVMEDAGDVGGEEELSPSPMPMTAGGPMRAATRVSGAVGGEDADGEGAGEPLDGAADGFVEGEMAGWGR